MCNVSYHGPSYLSTVLELGVMDAFVNILKSPDQDTIVTGLQFVEMALRSNNNNLIISIAPATLKYDRRRVYNQLKK